MNDDPLAAMKAATAAELARKRNVNRAYRRRKGFRLMADVNGERHREAEAFKAFLKSLGISRSKMHRLKRAGKWESFLRGSENG